MVGVIGLVSQEPLRAKNAKTDMLRKKSKNRIIFLWAHRRFSSRIQTHNAPFPPSRAAGVTAASNSHSTRRGQALPPDLRRTRPTFKIKAQPNRLSTQRLSVSPCFFAAPLGFPVPAGGHGRQKAKSARQRHPNSLPSFAPPSSTKNKMRPAHAAQRQNTSTLRRSGSFGYGRFSGRLCSPQRPAQAAYMPCHPSRCVVLAPTQPPVPKALRPPLHLSKRMAGSRGALPQMRDSVRPLCV